MTPDVRTRGHTLAAALAGLVAVGAGLAVGELVAALIDPAASPYFAVGAAVVDHAPTVGREFAIGTFGTADKPALYIGMGVLIAIIAAGCGIAERRRPPLGAAIIVVFGAIGVLAALDRPDSRWTFVLPSVLGAAVAVVVLRMLVGLLAPSDPKDPVGVDAVSPPDDATPSQGVGRRFVLAAGGVAALAVVVGTVGRRMLADTARTVADRTRIVLPTPRSAAPPVPSGADLDLPGATPFVTANDDFYRIDTALQVPNLTTDDWSLRIHGLVDNEIRIGWDELIAMPMTERLVTLTCVSNDVGGDLIDNARWLGVPMKTLLDRAGVQPGADMLLSTSSDGWTCGTPLSAVTDGRDALLVVGMNGEPLPVEHGFPVRQVVPGLYGYVSATKWVVDWELTRFADAEAYWTTRGWSALGPIKLASRIDRPTDARQSSGEVVLAGTAWAQHTGVAAVDVRIDEGPWQPAELATEYSVDTWRQWRFVWSATPGDHTVECRATDQNGQQQVEAYAAPIPDGATGLDSRIYTID
ncbi:molybdopterin-dependent oxidoreductase [Gordonia sp. LSe1-13]|uniref:Molybdopterin-dependent oxidoreductase n=1 Tax=Gordonia sesuvii TaxID=3116777 RepID=A0ABU7MJT3_9ACTN|nr:molybdopterin-dependent oxidoreductase [Gordonia sp. LSe1-13]